MPLSDSELSPDVFCTLILKTIKCNHCGNKERSKEKSFAHMLPIKHRSLKENLFELFQDSKWPISCKVCQSKDRTLIRRIKKLPDIMVLQFQKVSNGHGTDVQMNKVAIGATHDLDFTELMTENEQHSSNIYALNSFIEHHGSTLHFGHYTW